MRGNRYSSGKALDKEIGSEPLVVDWTKEEAKMDKVIRYIHVYCPQNIYLCRLCHIIFLARSVALKECYLMHFQLYLTYSIMKSFPKPI